VFDANKTAQEVLDQRRQGRVPLHHRQEPEGNYSIRTPTMTIGVRGTAFDLAVKAGTGESMVVVHEGITDLCDPLHRCSEGHAGSMSVGSAEGIRSVPAGLERTERLNAYFPLVQSQAGLDPVFVVQVPARLGINGGTSRVTMARAITVT